MNVYSYVNGNVVNLVDPMGLYWGEGVVKGIGSGVAWTGGKVWDGASYVPGELAKGARDWRKEPIGGIHVLEFDRDGNALPIRTIWEPSMGKSLTDAAKEVAHIKNIWLNGQANDQAAAELLSNYHTPYRDAKLREPVVIVHNDTTSFLADTAQSIGGKLVGPSLVAKQYAEFLQHRADNNIETHAYYHSQGGVMGTNAQKLVARNLSKSGKSRSWTNYTAEYHGSASNVLTSYLRVKQVGGQWGGMNNHRGDGVGNLIGLNSANPVAVGLSVLYFPALGIESKTLTQKKGFFGIYSSKHTIYRPNKAVTNDFISIMGTLLW